jgi:hypothetical protein
MQKAIDECSEISVVSESDDIDFTRRNGDRIAAPLEANGRPLGRCGHRSRRRCSGGNKVTQSIANQLTQHIC